MKIKNLIFLVLLFFIAYLSVISSNIKTVDSYFYKPIFTQHEAFYFGGLNLSETFGISYENFHTIGYTFKNYEESDFYTGDYLVDIYELNKSIYINGLDSHITSVNEVVYIKNTGFYTRTFPYLMSKLNFFNFNELIFLENSVRLISIMIFCLITLRIKDLIGLNASLIFFFMSITYGMNVASLRSLAIPYWIYLLPFLYFLLDNKNSNLKVFIVFLIPLFQHITSGYIPLLTAISAYCIKNIILNKKIQIKFLLNLCLNFLLAFLTTIFLVIFQNSYYKETNILNSSQLILKDTVSRSFLGTAYECVESGSIYMAIIRNYLNVEIFNVLDGFQIIDLKEILFLATISFLIYSKLKFISNVEKQKIIQLFFLIVVNFLLTFIWLFVTSNHAACHLHMQPKIFSYSLIPVSFIFFAYLWQQITNIFKKNYL